MTGYGTGLVLCAPGAGCAAVTGSGAKSCCWHPERHLCCASP